MRRAKKNNPDSYYPSGIDPKEHDIRLDYDVIVYDTPAYRKAEATLYIENPGDVSSYISHKYEPWRIWTYYVRGVQNWKKARKYMIDLLQVMMEELVKNTPPNCKRERYTAKITEHYQACREYIYYTMEMDLKTFSCKISVECNEGYIKGDMIGQKRIRGLMCTSPFMLYKKYLDKE